MDNFWFKINIQFETGMKNTYIYTINQLTKPHVECNPRTLMYPYLHLLRLELWAFTYVI